MLPCSNSFSPFRYCLDRRPGAILGEQKANHRLEALRLLTTGGLTERKKQSALWDAMDTSSTLNGESNGGRRRVLGIMASILVARHLKTTEDLHDSRPSPRT